MLPERLGKVYVVLAPAGVICFQRPAINREEKRALLAVIRLTNRSACEVFLVSS